MDRDTLTPFLVFLLGILFVLGFVTVKGTIDNNDRLVKLQKTCDLTLTAADNTRREWKDFQKELIKKGILKGE
jgi:hypothetical protein